MIGIMRVGVGLSGGRLCHGTYDVAFTDGARTAAGGEPWCAVGQS